MSCPENQASPLNAASDQRCPPKRMMGVNGDQEGLGRFSPTCFSLSRQCALDVQAEGRMLTASGDGYGQDGTCPLFLKERVYRLQEKGFDSRSCLGHFGLEAQDPSKIQLLAAES